MYPVGSCYFSTVSTSPSSTIGGTWTKMTGGMLGLTGSTGVVGAASNGGSRKISTSQMPSHTHTYGRRPYGGSFTSKLEWFQSNVGSGSSWLILSGADGSGWGVPEIASTGGVRIIFPHIPLFMVGDELLNLLGGEQ